MAQKRRRKSSEVRIARRSKQRTDATYDGEGIFLKHLFIEDLFVACELTPTERETIRKMFGFKGSGGPYTFADLAEERHADESIVMEEFNVALKKLKGGTELFDAISVRRGRKLLSLL